MDEKEKLIINNALEYVYERLSQDSTGHDVWHTKRVWQWARYIAQQENADGFLVELVALLHDVADWKFVSDPLKADRIIKEWLLTQELDASFIDKILKIINEISFKGAGTAEPKLCLEAQIVQDADRLDALGAIGIARTFAYGGYKARSLYDPTISAKSHATFEEYKNNQGTTLNHFYEKLFLLKDRMNTVTGKKLAISRHQYMEQFVDRFLNEWHSVPEA